MQLALIAITTNPARADGCSDETPCAHAYVNGRSIIVTWVVVGWDVYNVRWALFGQPENQTEVGDTSWHLDNIQVGATYVIKVQGCTTHTFGSSDCSPWDELRIYVGNPCDKGISAMNAKYDQFKNILGRETQVPKVTPDANGCYHHYTTGSIYWSAKYGAFEVQGLIRDKWAKLGWELSPLGYPKTDELVLEDNVGRVSNFDHGYILWTPKTGANAVYGAIATKYAALKWQKSPLGYPTTDENDTSDGKGRFNFFENGGIFWNPKVGAHAVYGAIFQKWASLGYEKSWLGYPVSDEEQNGIYRQSRFQFGTIRWTAQTGPEIVQ